ncbi:hypothetical protein PG984_003003 [Apiospora sp. TS-2023a]
MHFSKPIISSLAIVGASAQGLVTRGDQYSPKTLATVVSAAMPSLPVPDFTVTPDFTATTLGAKDAIPTSPPFVSQEFSLDPVMRTMLLGALKATLSKNMAQLCQHVDEETFLEKLAEFLNHWKPHSAIPKGADTMEVFEHLIILVSTADAVTQSPPIQFPNVIAALLRNALDLVGETGALRGDTQQSLQVVDIIFNDVCGGTGAVQKKVDIVVNPSMEAPQQ